MNIKASTWDCPLLEEINNLDEIVIEHVRGIQLGAFETEAEREIVFNKFPKSYKAKRMKGFSWEGGRPIIDKKRYFVYFEFQLGGYTTKVTGDKNESALARAGKVINKIKELLK